MGAVSHCHYSNLCKYCVHHPDFTVTHSENSKSIQDQKCNNINVSINDNAYDSIATNTTSSNIISGKNILKKQTYTLIAIFTFHVLVSAIGICVMTAVDYAQLAKELGMTLRVSGYMCLFFI